MNVSGHQQVSFDGYTMRIYGSVSTHELRRAKIDRMRLDTFEIEVTCGVAIYLQYSRTVEH